MRRPCSDSSPSSGPPWWFRTDGDYFFRGHRVNDRVVVFVDYQSCYRRAREIYFDHRSALTFMVRSTPSSLSLHLAADSPYDRVLDHVRVYRGMPSSARDSRGYAACRRKVDAWNRLKQVKVFTHPLQYKTEAGATISREKGVDVALAIDVATMTADKAYDVGIIVSLDTDLKPGLVYV